MTQPVHSVLFDSDLYSPQQQHPTQQPSHQPSHPPSLQFYQTTYDAPSQGGNFYPASTGGFYGGATTTHVPTGRIGGSLAGEGWLSAFGTGGYPDEPPLLEELGIHFGHIHSKTIAVLNPARRIDASLMTDADLAGPILFCLALAFFLLLVHFGYIYGVAVLGTVSLHMVTNLMAPIRPLDQQQQQYTPNDGNNSSSLPSLDIWKTASVLGYALLPMVILSGVAVVLPLEGVWGILAASVTVVWCTTAASGMLVALTQGVDQRALIAYPVGLLYACFALMTVF